MVILVSSERAKKADDSYISECARVCVEFRSLYFSCDLLIVLLLFSWLPIHFTSKNELVFDY